MNKRADRPTDEQIKEALLSGKTTAKVCKELKTHSQRIGQVREKFNLQVEVTHLRGGKGCKSKWIESGSSVNVSKSYRGNRDGYGGWF